MALVWQLHCVTRVACEMSARVAFAMECETKEISNTLRLNGIPAAARNAAAVAPVKRHARAADRLCRFAAAAAATTAAATVSAPRRGRPGCPCSPLSSQPRSPRLRPGARLLPRPPGCPLAFFECVCVGLFCAVGVSYSRCCARALDVACLWAILSLSSHSIRSICLACAGLLARDQVLSLNEGVLCHKVADGRAPLHQFWNKLRDPSSERRLSQHRLLYSVQAQQTAHGNGANAKYDEKTKDSGDTENMFRQDETISRQSRGDES